MFAVTEYNDGSGYTDETSAILTMPSGTMSKTVDQDALLDWRCNPATIEKHGIRMHCWTDRPLHKA